MSLTPTDDTDSRSASRSAPASETESSSVRSRVLCRFRRGTRRVAIACSRAVGWLAGGHTEADDRETETVALADSAVSPPDCPAIDGLPPRAFPLSYPTRSYRVIENDADLVADDAEGTLTISHPDVPTAYIESDTWTEIER